MGARHAVHRRGLKGASVPVTEGWKSIARARLKQLGKTQEWLAGELGVEPPSVTRLLNTGQPTSRIAMRAAEILDIIPPVMTLSSEDQHRLAVVAQRLFDLQSPRLRTLVESAEKILAGAEGEEEMAREVLRLGTRARGPEGEKDDGWQGGTKGPRAPHRPRR